jgi:hypothetical protein
MPITYQIINVTKTPGVNVIKLFTVVSYELSQSARAFVLGKPFQPSLIFAGKAGVYPIEAHFRCSNLG